MLRSGSICISFLYKYLTSENTKDKEDSGCEQLYARSNKLKCLSETFQDYGGVLAKLSQILSTNDQNSKVFSDCKPFSEKKTIEFLQKEYDNNPDFFEKVENLDFNVFKSGSVGQVHKAVYNNNCQKDDIILKVQYVGLQEQVKTDLYIFDQLINYLYHFSDLTHAMVDIKTKLYEELDYKLELSNQLLMSKLWNNNNNIKIPKIIPEICNEKILGMYFVEADNINYFIDNSTYEEKNIIAKYIIEFIFTNIYKHKIFYSDIHYGNFLIKNNKELYVMDFGCLINLDDNLHMNLVNLHFSILNDDIEKFYIILKDMKIINDDISEKSKEYIYEYFKLQYTPWTSDNFEFTNEWLDKSDYKNTELMKEWNLPPNIVYLNKIPYGLYNILTKLNANGNFKIIIDNILKDVYNTQESPGSSSATS